MGLDDKVSGNLLGLWLLVPEHQRLGTGDLLRTWSGDLAEGALAPRRALHLVAEAALCRANRRQDRSLRHKGFEHGLPFLPTDGALHDLIEAHTIAQAQQLQATLGQLRRASGHFPGRLLALDPHRLVNYSKRDMIPPCPATGQTATKQAQIFFLLDGETRQLLCLANASETFKPRRTTVSEPYCRYIQTTADGPEFYHCKGFCCTRPRPEVPTLTANFPKRWHREEFFRFEQDLGWKRAGTLNRPIRWGK